MHWLFILFISGSVYAGPSTLYSFFRESAGEWMVGQKANPQDGLKYELHALLDHHRINPDLLAKRLSRKLTVEREVAFAHSLSTLEQPVALHASRFDVLNPSDDWMKDDIYCYFFVSEGAWVTGKVTEVYKGLDRGESFHFSPAERSLFPADGAGTRLPRGALVVDYGIVESDGDDIRELQKISALIIDLAALIYASQDPRWSAVVLELRQEVKALAQALLSGDHDDRLVTGTISWNNERAIKRLRDEPWWDVRRTHHSRYFFNQWKYRLNFRLWRE